MKTAASLVKDPFVDKNTTLRPKSILETVENRSVKTPSCQLLAKRKVGYLEDLPHANESSISSYKKRLPLKNPGIKLSLSSLILLFR